MRLILLLSVFLLFMNCEDKKTKQNAIPKTKTTEAQKTENTNTVAKKEERTYPKLNSKSAMEFFMEYDKQHKENKVRITTDFGTIDILLFNETKFHRSNFIFLTKHRSIGHI